ncbi:hypothetical protein WHR41_01575 [Cladosporium halotolerans]|uniref:DUF3835 domain-containing protein n=1 Tax=Cladosporium halotolerans TaxID=1052096 RepID=A0AB34L2R9_9PEZI
MELTEIERQRQLLEANVQKLRQSLKHWQTWEAEYEGLKEELVATGPEDLTADAVASISRSYDGALVTEKEILDLAFAQPADVATLRRRAQILGLISRRQEYVLRNIETVSRQFFAAEGKLEEFAFASVTAAGVYGDGAGELEDEEEGGLPLSEIHEELDESGNVLRGEVRRPEEATGQVLERLRKAGLSERDLGMAGGEKASEPAAVASGAEVSAPSPAIKPAPVSSVSKDAPVDEDDGPDRPPIRKKSVSFSADTKEPEERPRSNSDDSKKSVSFADKVAVARAADPPDTRSVSFSPQVEEIPAQTASTDSPQSQSGEQTAVNTDPDRQKDLRGYFKPGDRVFEVNEDTETTTPHVVMPENESEEDARLRREMLNYHLNEVQNVVATMDLDDPDDEHDDSHSDFTASEYQDEDTPYTSGLSDSDAEDEDEFGRSRKPAVTDAYREEMEALKERLIGNLGKIPLPEEGHDEDEDEEDADQDLNPADARRLVIRQKRSSIASTASSTSDADATNNKKSSTAKKRVSFAQDLDVADPPHKAPKNTEDSSVPVAPLASGVVERSATTSASPCLPTPTAPAKLSRFKQSRAAQDEDSTSGASAPNPPPGIPMADTLLERSPAAAKAPDPDGYDPLLARRELAADYYRRRNDMVREQGGFKGTKEEDEDKGELMEEGDDGRVKKVSRFRAARLGK